jgi:hypothetical protein
MKKQSQGKFYIWSWEPLEPSVQRDFMDQFLDALRTNHSLTKIDLTYLCINDQEAVRLANILDQKNEHAKLQTLFIPEHNLSSVGLKALADVQRKRSRLSVTFYTTWTRWFPNDKEQRVLNEWMALCK